MALVASPIGTKEFMTFQTRACSFAVPSSFHCSLNPNYVRGQGLGFRVLGVPSLGFHVRSPLIFRQGDSQRGLAGTRVPRDSTT